MKYQCPVCGYDQLTRPPEDYNICPSCWTEFGNDDIDYTINELRARWIDSGYAWHGRVIDRPANWNPKKQLERVISPLAVDDNSEMKFVDTEIREIVQFGELDATIRVTSFLRAVTSPMSGNSWVSATT